MLIAFLALIALMNGVFGWVHGIHHMGWFPDSMEKLFGIVFAPIAWLLGVSWKDASAIGNLLGTRLVLNEFVAFLQLGPMRSSLDPRSFTIATYALCGFANFSSIAIQIGGIGGLAPNRKSDLARLGLKAVAAGTMANFMSACHRGHAAMIDAAVEFIRSQTTLAPRVAVVLGSGLGEFADELCNSRGIPFSAIPGWPQSTAVGHAGLLLFGEIDGVPVAVQCGRAHLYEGYSPWQVTFGVRVLKRLGVETLVVTNAAGGINLNYTRGTLVLVSDHINLQGSNPLAGPNDESFGPRFPDMTEAYSQRLRDIARTTGAELGIELPEGVYAALLGPNYETPAEIRYLRAIGADLVGMSTVPEVLAANHCGMKVLAISCVTNMAAGILNRKLDHQEVLETGRMVRGTLVKLLRALLPRIAGLSSVTSPEHEAVNWPGPRGQTFGGVESGFSASWRNASLKFRIPSPRPLASSGIFLPPNSNAATARMTSSSGQPIVSMICLCWMDA